MQQKIAFVVVLLQFTFIAGKLENNGQFPRNFLFGAATASYQIEGSWNVDGKGQSTWDEFTHRIPSPITNNDTGDVACDHYKRYKEDIKMAANLGLQAYRFSISWPRVLPSGYADTINQKGLQFYKNLVDEIVKYGMVPVCTLFHWDFPLKLYEEGIDWRNEKVIDIFVAYSRLMIQNLPKVGYWSTINEPRVHCLRSYGDGKHAPGVVNSGVSDYQCSYIILKAHAKAYHMYKQEFPHYKAPFGIVIDCQWYEPATDTPEDIEAANRYYEFECGMYFHPISKGDWPDVVKKRIARRSQLEGHSTSRLPEITPGDIKLMKGTQDYIAINHYFTTLVANAEEASYGEISYRNDVRANLVDNPAWKKSVLGWAIVPFGARKLLNHLKEQYGNEPIIFAEIGVADDGSSLKDDIRIEYYEGYFCYILEAMQIDDINVVAIIPWSLMDNLEWAKGYIYHFGLIGIDFYNDATLLTRKLKDSAHFYKKVTNSKRINCANVK
nr:myrosinase 1 [Phyllotreta armoraciae]